MRAQPRNGRSIQPTLKTHYAGISAAVVVEIFDKRGHGVRGSLCLPSASGFRDREFLNGGLVS
jgi:hypothetical protein